MPEADWTQWQTQSLDNAIRAWPLRAAGSIYYMIYDLPGNQVELWVLDEASQESAITVQTISPPAGATSIAGRNMVRHGQALYLLCSATRTGWFSYPLVYRYDINTGDFGKVLDGFTELGFSHSYTTLDNTNIIQSNNVGMCFSCTENTTSPVHINRGLLIATYNGYNWFEAHNFGVNHASGTGPAIQKHPYIMIARDSGSGGTNIAKATTSLSSWSVWSYWSPSLTEIMNFSDLMWSVEAANPDRLVWTNDAWFTSHTFPPDTGLTAHNNLNASSGRLWVAANNGLKYKDVDNGTWVLDFPNLLNSNWQFLTVLAGYSGNLFFFANFVDVSGTTGLIYKRGKLGGGATGIGKGSKKLSVDRNSSMVYCTTYGLGTKATDYWSVTSNLNTVTLMDQSTVSGVLGSVHSAENAGVYEIGNVEGDLVKRSKDYGVTFSGYLQPVPNCIEATTLFSLRDNALPDDVIITVTISGGTNHDMIYAYPSGAWSLLASGSFIAESAVRRGIHSLLGVYSPLTGSLVDYSSDGGFNWEQRDTGLPTVSITDIEFA